MSRSANHLPLLSRSVIRGSTSLPSRLPTTSKLMRWPAVTSMVKRSTLAAPNCPRPQRAGATFIGPASLGRAIGGRSSIKKQVGVAQAIARGDAQPAQTDGSIAGHGDINDRLGRIPGDRHGLELASREGGPQVESTIQVSADEGHASRLAALGDGGLDALDESLSQGQRRNTPCHEAHHQETSGSGRRLACSTSQGGIGTRAAGRAGAGGQRVRRERRKS